MSDHSEPVPDIALDADFIIVHRTPQGRAYAPGERHHRGERIRPDTFPDSSLAVEEIMPPRRPTTPG